MIYTDTIQVSGSPIGKPSVLPKLRDPLEHNTSVVLGEVPKEYKDGFGCYTGFRVLPYLMQNHYTREREPMELKTLIYENDLMKTTFLPEYGGRLYSLYDKTLGTELLTKNPIFQPANLANRNAWFSGGVEWNLGRYGHSFLTCEDVYFGRVERADGGEILRMYAFERLTKLFYQIDFYLPSDKALLVTMTHVYNIYDTAAPLYYWSNTAVPQNGSRVFSSSTDALYLQPQVAVESQSSQVARVDRFGFGHMPSFSQNGIDAVDFDASYPENFLYSSEFFYQNTAGSTYPWEAVAYKDGRLFFEYSTQPLEVRKMFCWGVHEGGKRWQEFLSLPDAEPYLEVQAGIHPTQCHTKLMDPRTHLSWLQVFGGLGNLDTRTLYGEFSKAQDYVQATVEHNIFPDYTEYMNTYTFAAVSEILHHGTPWGTVELDRLQKEEASTEPLPKEALSFSYQGSEDGVSYFRKLIDGNIGAGTLRNRAPRQSIGYTADPAWEPYLLQACIEAKPEEKEIPILQLALIYAEGGEVKRAIALMEEQQRENQSSLSLRTLGALYMQAAKESSENKKQRSLQEQALFWYTEAIASIEDCKDLSYYREDLWVEYAELLASLNRYNQLWDLLNTMEPWYPEELRVIRSIAAFELGKIKEAEEIFTYPLERIREADTRVVDLWFAIEAVKQGVANTPEFRLSQVAPRSIDFRMHS